MAAVHVTVVRIHQPSRSARSRNFYSNVTIDGTSKTTQDNIVASGWDRLIFNVSGSSKLTFNVFKRRLVQQNTFVGSYEDNLETLLTKSWNGSITKPLCNTTLSNSVASGYRIEFKVELEANQDSAVMAAMLQRVRIQASRLNRTRNANGRVMFTGIQAASDISRNTIVEAWNPLLDKLRIFSNLADTVAEVHPYAKAAYSVVSMAYKAVLDQMQRDINILSLVQSMDDIYSFVKEAEPLRRIDSHRSIMTCLAQQTTECGYFISAYCADAFMTRAVKHSMTTDAAIIQYGQRFCDLKAALLAHATIQTEISVLRILDTVERLGIILRYTNFPLTDVQLRYLEVKVDLGDLPYANGARFQSSMRCMPGTCEEILNNIINWIDDPRPDGKHVFILVGAEGAGKSTIAHSIASHYRDLGRLGSSIFTDLPNDSLTRTQLPVLLFPTISRDLADLDPHYRRALWSVIESDKALRRTLDPADQCEKFIVAPSTTLTISGPIAIVLDALDDCTDSTALHKVLSVLSKRSKDFPSNFRIFITVRTGSRILRLFEENSAARIYKLEDIDNWSSHYDLSQIVRARLRAGLDESQLEQFPTRFDWELVAKSQRSYRWIKEACDAICRINLDTDQQHVSAFERYEDLIHPSKQFRVPVPPEDYLVELTRISTSHGASFIGEFQSVMGTLLVSYVSLSFSELEKLSGKPNDASTVICAMDALLMNTNSCYTPIVPFHPSFYDFLRDSGRSGEFCVDISIHHLSLATTCVRILNSQLRFNICRLSSSFCANADVGGLADRTRRYITPELSYAARFWIKHLHAAVECKLALANEIEMLLQNRFFFWLEVLSILDCVDVAIKGLQSIISWTNVDQYSPQVKDLAKQALFFVETFQPAIILSVPHIYVSAIRFWPKELQEHFQSSFYFPLTSNSQINQDCFSCGGDKMRISVDSVAFSPDCRRILAIYSDGLYCVWNTLSENSEAYTTKTILSGADMDQAFASFSSDGVNTTLAVFSKNGVRRLDTTTGEALSEKRLNHPSDARIRALRRDGQRIALASGEYGALVSIYDTTSGDLDSVPLHVPLGLKEQVDQLALSPLGTFLASGTDQGRLWLWNILTGDEVFTYKDKNSDGPRHLLFFPEEKYLISVHPQNIYVVDAQEGRILHIFDLRFMPSIALLRCIDISPTGQYLVFGVYNKRRDPQKIYFIDLETGAANPIPPLSGPLEANVSSVSFSTDGSMIAAGLDNGTVRLWRVASAFGRESSLWAKGDESGWILGPKKELLAWVPSDLRATVNWTPPMWGEAHGTLWTKCLIETPSLSS